MIYTIENRNLRVQVNSMGAELWSLTDKRDNTEHLWQGDKSVWPRRAPTLFPYCGRLKGSHYVMGGKDYESPIHGFARDYEHTLVHQDQISLEFLLTDNPDTHRFYPLSFRLFTKFLLKDDQLAQSFTVENAGSGEMAFSIGYHTGFRLPFDGGHSISDYSLVFDKAETPINIQCDNAGLLNGKETVYFENKKVIPVNEELFPSFILTDLKSEHVSIVEADTGRTIRIGIKGFPYVTFWSMPNKVHFVCVEPWHGLPDKNDTDGQFDKKPGIVKLPEGGQFNCQMTIDIIKK